MNKRVEKLFATDSLAKKSNLSVSVSRFHVCDTPR